jgi:hypothetical protein
VRATDAALGGEGMNNKSQHHTKNLEAQVLFERGWSFAEIAKHLKSTPIEIAIRIGRSVDFLLCTTTNGEIFR